MRKTPKKVLSFILAIALIFTSLAAGFTAFAYEDSVEYKYNYMDWSVLTYEQQMKALFDYVDAFLAQLNFKMDLSVLGSLDATSINALVGSVKGLGGTAESFSGLLGDLKGIKFTAFDSLDKSNARGVNGDAAIAEAIFAFLADDATITILNRFLDNPTGFNFGIVGNFVSIDIGGMLGLSSGEKLPDLLKSIIYQAVTREDLRIDSVKKTYVTDKYKPIFAVYNKLVEDKTWSDSIMIKACKQKTPDEALQWWSTYVQELVDAYNADYEMAVAVYNDNGTPELTDDTVEIDGEPYELYKQYTYLHYDYYMNNTLTGEPAYTWDANFLEGKNSQNGSGDAWDAYWNFWDAKAKDQLSAVKAAYPTLDEFVWGKLIGNAENPGIIERLINTITDPEGEIDFPDLTPGAVQRILCPQSGESYAQEFDNLNNILYKAIVEIWNPYIVPMLNTICVDDSGFYVIERDSTVVYNLIQLFNLDWKTDPANSIGDYNDFAGKGLKQEFNNFCGYLVESFIKQEIRKDFVWEKTALDASDEVIFSTFVKNFKKLIVFFLAKTDSSLLPDAMSGKSLSEIYSAWDESFDSLKVADLMFKGVKVVIQDYITQLHKDELDKADTTAKLVYLGLTELAAQYLPELDYTALPEVGSADFNSWPLDSTTKALKYNTVFDVASDIITYFVGGQAPLFTDVSTAGSNAEKYYKLEDAKTDRKDVFEVLNLAANYYLYGNMAGANLAGLQSAESDTAFAKLDEIIKYIFSDTDIANMGSNFFSTEAWLSTDINTETGKYEGKVWNIIFDLDAEGLVDIFEWLFNTKAVSQMGLLELIYYPLYNGINKFVKATSSLTSGNASALASTPLLKSDYATLNADGKPIEALISNDSIKSIINNLLKILNYRKKDILPLAAAVVGSLIGITGEQSLGLASATVTNSINGGTAIAANSYYTVYNNCKGINRSYVKNGVRVYDSLYQVVVTGYNVTTTDISGNVLEGSTVALSGINVGDIIPSSGYTTYSLSGNTNHSADAIVTINLYYNIIDESGINSEEHYVFQNEAGQPDNKIITTNVYCVYDTSTFYSRLYNYPGKRQVMNEQGRNNFIYYIGEKDSDVKWNSCWKEREGANTFGEQKIGSTIKVNVPRYVVTDTAGTNMEKYLWYAYCSSGTTVPVDTLSAYENNANVGTTYVGAGLHGTYNATGGTGKYNYDHTFTSTHNAQTNYSKYTYYHLPAAGEYFETWDKYGFTPAEDTLDLDNNKDTLWYSVDPNAEDLNYDGVYDEKDYVFYTKDPRVDRYSGLDLNTILPSFGMGTRDIAWMSLFTTKNALAQKIGDGATSEANATYAFDTSISNFSKESLTPGVRTIALNFYRSDGNAVLSLKVCVEDDVAKTALQRTYDTIAKENRQAADFDLSTEEAQTAWANYKAILSETLSALSAVVDVANCESQNYRYYKDNIKLSAAVKALDKFSASVSVDDVKAELEAMNKEVGDRLNWEFFTYQRYLSAYNSAVAVANNEDVTAVELKAAIAAVNIQKANLISRTDDLVSSAETTDARYSKIKPEIARFANYNKENYTTASWNVYEDAYNRALAVVAGTDYTTASGLQLSSGKPSKSHTYEYSKGVTMIDIKEAREALMKAENALVLNVATTCDVEFINNSVSFSATNGVALETALKDIFSAAGTPELTGYTFTGWAVQGFEDDATYNAPFDELTATLNDVLAIVGEATKITFVAQYSTNNYTITYNLNNGTNAETNPTNYTVTSDTIVLADPTRAGYTFDGWYDNATFTGSPVTQIATGSTGDKTLYAKWTATDLGINGNTYKFTVTYGAKEFTSADALPSGVTFNITAGNNKLPTGITPNATSGIVIDAAGVTGNVGKTTTQVSATDTSNGTVYQIYFEVTVNAADRAEPTWSTTGKTYDGSALTVTASPADGEEAFGSVTYKYVNKASGAEVAEIKDAGTYTVTATIAATDHYAQKVASTEVTITAKTYAKGDVEVTTVNTTYGPSATVTSANFDGKITGIANDATYTVTFKPTATETTPVASVANAGTYDVVVTIAASNNYGTATLVYTGALVIDKLAYDIASDAIATEFNGQTKAVDYDGTAKTFEVASADPSIYTISYNYSGDKTSVGSNEVTATVNVVNTNYSIATTEYTATLTINAVAPTVAIEVTAENSTSPANAIVTVTVPANGSAPAGTVKVTPSTGSAVEGIALTRVGETNVYTTESTQILANVGSDEVTYTAEYIPGATDNYATASKETKYTAGATAMTTPVTVSGPDSVTYGETITFTAAGGEGPELKYTFNYSTADFIEESKDATTITLKAIKAGSASVTATATATGYNASTSEAKAVTIDQKTVAINTTAANKVYDKTTAATVTFAVDGSDVVLGDTLTITNVTSYAGTFASADVANGITVTPTATASDFTLSSANYKVGTVGTATANITARPLTLSFVVENKEYDGTNSFTVVSGSATDAIDGDTVAVDVSGATATAADANVATNKAVTVSGYTVTGADNYSYSASTAATATISQKTFNIALTGSVIGSTVVYDGSNKSNVTATVDATYLPDGADVKYYKADEVEANPAELADSLFTLTEAVDEGIYYARAIKAPTANVKYTSDTVTFTVAYDTTPHISVSYNNTAATTQTVTINASVGIDGRGDFAPVVEVQKDGGEWTTVSGSTYVVDKNGVYTFRATYGENNATDTATFTKIDALYATASVASSYVSGSWANTATFTVSVDDSYGANAAANKNYYYSTNGGASWTQIGTATTDNSAVLTVDTETVNKNYTFKATIDNDGAARDLAIATAYVVNVDVDAPAAPVITGAVDAQNSTTVTISAADALSGVAKVEYAVATTDSYDGDYTTYTNGFTVNFNEEGTNTYYVFVKVTDNAGNVTNARSDAFTITKAFYVVLYDVNGDLLAASGTYDNGYVLTLPTAAEAGVNTTSHNFLGWATSAEAEATVTDASITVTDNVELYAKAEIKTFTVKIFDGDGSEMSSQVVAYGNSAEAPATTPTKAPEGEKTYTFLRWDKSFANVTSDLNVNPVFAEGEVTKYTVTFKDYNGNSLGSTTVVDGETVAASVVPSATATYQDVEKVYTFDSWKIDGTEDAFVADSTAITGNITVVPVYTSVARQYTVTFMNGETVVDSKTVDYGTTTVTTAVIPEKAATAQYTYTFKHWSLTNNGTAYDLATPVSGDVVLYAVFDSTVNEYTVTFKDADGTELTTKTVAYNSALGSELPEYTGSLVDNAEWDYTFNGWYNGANKLTASTRITANITVTANVTQERNKYTVTVYAADGSVASLADYDYGTALNTIITSEPTKAGDAVHSSYTFDKWVDGEDATVDVATATVTGNIDLTPVFTDGPFVEYTLTFTVAGETVYEKTDYHYGDEVNASAIVAAINASSYATANEVTFMGWIDTLPATVTANGTYRFSTKSNADASLLVHYVYELVGNNDNPSYVTYSALPASTDRTFEEGTIPTLQPVDAIPGYEIVTEGTNGGWVNEDGTPATVEIVSNTNKGEKTYKIKMQPVVAWVEFYNAQGTLIGGNYGGTKAAGTVLTLPNATYYGLTAEYYDFAGWTEGSVGGTPVTTRTILANDLGNTVKIYANEVNNGVTIEFYNGDSLLTSVIKKVGSTLTLKNISNPTVENCTTAWVLNGTTTPVESVTLTADMKALGLRYDLWVTPTKLLVKFYQADGSTPITETWVDVGQDIIALAPESQVTGLTTVNVLKGWIDFDVEVGSAENVKRIDSWEVSSEICGTAGLNKSGGYVQNTLSLKAWVGAPLSVIVKISTDPDYDRINSEIAMVDALLVFKYVANPTVAREVTDKTIVMNDTYTIAKNSATMLNVAILLIQLKALSSGE